MHKAIQCTDDLASAVLRSADRGAVRGQGILTRLCQYRTHKHRLPALEGGLRQFNRVVDRCKPLIVSDLYEPPFQIGYAERPRPRPARGCRVAQGRDLVEARQLKVSVQALRTKDAAVGREHP